MEARARAADAVAPRPAGPSGFSPSTSNWKMSFRTTTSPSRPQTSVTWVIRRTPSRCRSTCTIRSMALTIWVRIAFEGRPMLPIWTMFSIRVIASRVVLAWTVDMLPSWPVFIACSMSNASPPRTSPMMMRSGRIRSALRSRSRWVISPRPSRLDGRVSIRTTCGCCSCSSAASSTVMTRSSLWIRRDIAFSSVVLPDPVPPEMTTLRRDSPAISSTRAITGVSEP